MISLCSSISVGEREEEGERREDISASTVCFLFVDVAWRLLNFKNMQSAVDCE